MNLGEIIKGGMDWIGGAFNFISNPVEAIKLIGIGIGTIFLGIPIFDGIVKGIDDAIIFVDNKVIDVIPFKPIKDFLQGKLISRLQKRVNRYQEIIKEISD